MTIIVALFFFSGINAVFLGIIGEYVGRIYHQARYGRRVAVRRLLNIAEESGPSRRQIGPMAPMQWLPESIDADSRSEQVKARRRRRAAAPPVDARPGDPATSN
jgi:hypothetical protein